MSERKSINVVLALNASEHSKYAFNWAINNLLRTTDHKVTLLTVVEPPVQAGYYYAASAGKRQSMLNVFIMMRVAMYSPSFIDEVYKKAQDDATKLVRQYQGELEKAFDVFVLCH